MTDALREVEAAFKAMGDGRVDLRPRQRVHVSGAGLSVMAAGWPERGYYGFKFYSYTAKGARFWFHLFDARSGELIAVMQADRLGQRRTGAASGIATKHLARRDASIVGIVGTGWQAESQLEAVCSVRSVREIRCLGRRAAARLAFARKMTTALGVDVKPVESGSAVAEKADIVVTSTTSSEPVLFGDWLSPGTHVNAMGANRPDAREIDDATIRRSAFVAVDSIEQTKIEAGDLLIPVSKSLLRWDWVHELAEVVAGRVRGRESAEDITLFKSLGIAIEDVAVAAFVYERARKVGSGKEITL
jgi:alanine dehydrogenase